MKLCSQCELFNAHSRTLCTKCYQQAYRAGLLSEYPTTDFMKNPEVYIRWAYEQFPDLVHDIGIEFS